MPPTPKASPKIDQFLSNRHRQIGINSSFLLLNLTHLLEPAEAWCCLDLNGRKCFGDHWGWLARITQLQRMAVELLQEKGDTEPLGRNWQSSFLRRHPELKSKFVTPRDRKRYVAQSRENFMRWFNLYLEQKTKYQVHDNDTYNLDEKGVMMGVAGKVRVILSKYEKNPYTTHPGNREWVTFTECCSLTGRKLGSWTMFKGKAQQKTWFQTMERLENYDICTSESGWTDIYPPHLLLLTMTQAKLHSYFSLASSFPAFPKM